MCSWERGSVSLLLRLLEISSNSDFKIVTGIRPSFLQISSTFSRIALRHRLLSSWQRTCWTFYCLHPYTSACSIDILHDVVRSLRLCHGSRRTSSMRSHIPALRRAACRNVLSPRSQIRQTPLRTPVQTGLEQQSTEGSWWVLREAYFSRRW